MLIESEIEQLKRRVLNIEKKLEMDFTPREQAERISQGIEKPHHIGPKSREVLKQEIYSLLNTKRDFRKPDFDKQVLSRLGELSKIVGDEQAIKDLESIYKYLSEKEQRIYQQLKEVKHD